MNTLWILSVESWPICTDIPLVEQGGKLRCAWSRGRFSIHAELRPCRHPVLSFCIKKGKLPLLRAETPGTAQAGGWIFELKFKRPKQLDDEFDRSRVRISVTPDAHLRGLFANAPFGLSYMPIMRHIIEISPPKAILEWGPGRSTLLLAESLSETSIFSIEHHPDWYERIGLLAERYPQVVPIYEPVTLKPGKSGKYITAPLYLGRKFDLIFVDGRLRTDCIAVASQLLNDNGSVLVHDANRICYSQAFTFFASKHIVNDTAILRR